ncbi:MAG: hypothetical protein A2297_06440 [Elusimicrobia bacterium RIFOXYB2_FULL_48_7]|nr:MAG: hypothetical protein A2297_06440 [Elusimicrobia bacterium RIFOXYB2_FULL_48_7]
MDKKLRYGLIGCGDIAKSERTGIVESGNSELIMVMDANPEFAEKFGKEFNVPYTSDLKVILKRKDIDAVVIAVPHFLHKPIAIAAAKKKKHVVIEKPIATNIKDARKIIKACQKNGVKLSVPFVYRYKPATVKAKELFQKGVIGKVINISSIFMGYKPESYWTGGWSQRVSTDWRAIKEKSGGGILVMNSIHNIDLLFNITGLKAERVYSEYGTFATKVEVEDMVAITLRYDNGAVGCIEASSTAFGKGELVDHIYGTEGQIEMKDDKLRVFTTKAVEGLKANEWNEIPLPEGVNARAAFTRSFSDAILNNKPLPVTAEEALQSLEIVFGAYLSGTKKKPVKLPLK